MKHFKELSDLAKYCKVDTCVTFKHNLICKTDSNTWKIIPYDKDEDGYFLNNEIDILEFDCYAKARNHFISNLKKVLL